MAGISVYSGIGISLEDNLKYMEMAKENGITHVFTSFHLPESVSDVNESVEIMKKATELNLKLSVDVSKKYMEKYDWSQFNIDTLRLDFGFSDKEIADLSNSNNFRISLNASTIDEKNLESLLSLGLKTSNVEVCHNFYPRRNTGISLDLLKERNKLFKSYGFTIAAFTASLNEQRGPIFEGLPTLESHRFVPPFVAAQELYRNGVDFVYIGDFRASLKEIQLLTSLDDNFVLLPVEKYDMNTDEQAIFDLLHQNRPDEAKDVIRSTKSRELGFKNIKPYSNLNRDRFSITIDNEKYLRYQGELQITKTDLEADDRVNVVGKVLYADLLIPYIKSNTSFKFITDF